MLYKDYRNGSYSKYRTELKKRLKGFQDGTEGDLILQKIQSPLILRHWEVSQDSEHWSNKCYKDYLKRNYDFNVDRLIIKKTEPQ